MELTMPDILALLGDDKKYAARLTALIQAAKDLDESRLKIAQATDLVAAQQSLQVERKALENERQTVQVEANRAALAGSEIIRAAQLSAKQLLERANADKDAIVATAGEHGSNAEFLFKAAQNAKESADTYAKEIRYQADFDRAEAKRLLEVAQAKVDSLNAFRSAW